MLGEARSKCEHIASVPLRPSTEKDLHLLYLAKGALATTAIEGNTLSEAEVLQHLRGQLKLPLSQEYLAKEIDNIVQACNQIVKRIRAGESRELTVQDIAGFNRLVLNGLEVEAGVTPGEVRRYSVGVAGYRAAPHEDCEILMECLCQWLNGPDFHPSPQETGLGLIYAIIRATLGHLYLAWIHPFRDGNGRTARLIEFQILATSGVPTPAAHLLSNHYNQTRSEYYRQLEKARTDALSFIHYAVQGFVDGLRSQLALIRQQQWDIAWENYVHDEIPDKASPSSVRRRHLLLDLSDRAEPVPPGEFHNLSPRVAAAYAQKTAKTLSRDLNALREMDLIELTPRGYRAKKERTLAFLPLRSGSAES
ncbi:MAG: Fic family protein [Terriglobales bacterium]